LYGARIYTILMETPDIYSHMLSLIRRFALRPESRYCDKLHCGRPCKVC